MNPPLQLPLLVVREVTTRYRMGGVDVDALKGISLTVQAGEFMALAGTSGSGKTTLLNLIGAIDTPSSGDILIDGIPLRLLRPDELARFRCKKLGFIFQTFNLIPTLSTLENVEYPLLLLGMSKRQRRKMASEALEQVGLGKKLLNKPSELSGGQRQRVAIARAMAKKPRLILADEPTANLDRKTAIEILDLMQKLNKELQTTFVFSTHDHMILQRAERTFFLADGEHSEAPLTFATSEMKRCA
ncbi:ABC transporter ATP-binding protein [bacterium]|nr:ABC transporter ATP-binding protein [bacterium]